MGSPGSTCVDADLEVPSVRPPRCSAPAARRTHLHAAIRVPCPPAPRPRLRPHPGRLRRHVGALRGSRQSCGARGRPRPIRGRTGRRRGPRCDADAIGIAGDRRRFDRRARAVRNTLLLGARLASGGEPGGGGVRAGDLRRRRRRRRWVRRFRRRRPGLRRRLRGVGARVVVLRERWRPPHILERSRGHGGRRVRRDRRFSGRHGRRRLPRLRRGRAGTRRWPGRRGAGQPVLRRSGGTLDGRFVDEGRHGPGRRIGHIRRFSG